MTDSLVGCARPARRCSGVTAPTTGRCGSPTPDGRFDLADTEGTCYTAESEQITLLETWGGMRVIPSTELANRAVSRMQVTTDRILADLTSNTAAQFGVTAEIFTTGTIN